MFFELARPEYTDRDRGGVQFLSKIIKNSMVFFIQDSIPALKTHQCFKNSKVVTDRQTDKHFGPVLNQFGAVTVAIHVNSGFQSEIATCFSTEPVSEPVLIAVYGVLLDLHVSKSSA